MVRDLIENHGADEFYAGHRGYFDHMAAQLMQRLKEEYPHISFTVVPAYLNTSADLLQGVETVFPEGMENVPLRFAIARRNEWMIKNCDAVVTCVLTHRGGAYKAREMAQRKGKTVIDIGLQDKSHCQAGKIMLL